MAGPWHVATAQESQRAGTGGSECQIARERVRKHELVYLGRVPHNTGRVISCSMAGRGIASNRDR